MRKSVWMTGAAAVLFALMTVNTHAQTVKREPISPISGVDGAATYAAYCAQCHGVSAKGDGPAAKALKVAPADLTLIAKRHNGKYPASVVKDSIVGMDAVAAHGTRDMPMWGPVFRSVENGSVTELRVVNLVKYLEGLQQK